MARRIGGSWPLQATAHDGLRGSQVTTKDENRLIEDYLPIQAISKEASREKSVRKGHISTLHLW